MVSVVKINNKDLKVKEFRGQRVVTLKEIDLIHDRPDGTAKRNFIENKNKFISDMDYFEVSTKNVPSLEVYGFSKFAPNGILLTESGYLMLVKSLTDDLAWEVQRQLVNSYFRVKEIVKPEGLKAIALLHAEVGEIIAATTQIENRVESLENTMTIDYSQQLVLQEIAKAVAVESMGGKDKPCYKNSSLRSKVFAQVWRDYKEYFQVNSYKNTARVEFDKAKEYLKGWKAQGKLLREIEDINNQLELEA